SVVPDLPPGFSEVVSRCLEKDPETRFLNVAELAYALVPFSTDPGRARAVADRIAAVLSLPHSGDVGIMGGASSPHMARGSSPSPLDSGTAAPWSGTHGSGRTRNGPRGITIIAACALAALLIGSIAKIHHNARSAAARDLEDDETATSAPAAPVQV